MTHKGTVTLETERLILRRFEISDAEAMFRNSLSDVKVPVYMTWKPYEDIRSVQNYIMSVIDGYKNLSYYHWGIVVKEIGEPIGSIGVERYNNETRSVGIGYSIGSKWWHKGYMSEALIRLVQFFFEEVNANRIESQHDTRNPNSGKVMRKAGFQYEGLFRQSEHNNQGIHDSAHYAILAEDYFGHRDKETSVIPNNYEYRSAVPSDAPELLKLNDLFNGEGCNSLAAIEASLKNNKQEIVCVAADGETLIGFCCGQIFKSMCYDVNYGEITELFVVESYRGQGVASGLMSFIESEFRNQGINHFQLFTGGEKQVRTGVLQKTGI